MRKVIAIAFIMLAEFSARGSRADAGLIYDNGPINGQETGVVQDGIDTGAYPIMTGGLGGNELTNSFTVASASHLTHATFGIWAPPEGFSRIDIQYAIGTTPFGSDVALNFLLHPTNMEFLFTNNNARHVYKMTFDLDADVPPGTYWITLFGLGGGNHLRVDANNGPSLAYYALSHRLFDGSPPLESDYLAIPSSSFQIYGDGELSAVPEPSSLALLMTGIVGSLCVWGKRQRRNPSTAANS